MLVAVRLVTGYDAGALVAHLEGQPSTQDPHTWCTSEYAVPYALVAGGAGRSTTLRVEPFGCGVITNGTAIRYARQDKAFLRGTAPRPRACPQQAGARLRPANQGPGLADALVPGDVRTVLVCRYAADGSRTPPVGKSAYQLQLTGNWVRQLAADLNAAPLPIGGEPSCPAPTGTLVVIAVAADRVTAVWVHPGVCGRLDNGTRLAYDPELAAYLDRMVPGGAGG